jgi:hypothetical protein
MNIAELYDTAPTPAAGADRALVPGERRSRAPIAETKRPVELPAASSHELVRPWRTAALVAGTIAAAELVVLIAVGAVLVAKPLSRTLQRHAEATALAPAKKQKPAEAARTRSTSTAARLTRSQTSVMVLNGNGRSGAAAGAATRLHNFGYVVAATGNARRQDYASSVVMYRAGYRGEALRLAHDLKIRVVGPLDGMRKGALMGGHLAVIVGA